jgi:uncharacterized protein YjbI with pentapeptide repeats
MLGVAFADSNPLGMQLGFEDCVLSQSTFYKLKLRKTSMKKCILNEVDWVEADLSESVFEECDFQGAIFDQTNLEKADFRSSYNYYVDVMKNRVRRAKFAFPGLIGLLEPLGVIVEK